MLLHYKIQKLPFQLVKTTTHEKKESLPHAGAVSSQAKPTTSHETKETKSKRDLSIGAQSYLELRGDFSFKATVKHSRICHNKEKRQTPKPQLKLPTYNERRKRCPTRRP